jgi:hypothetical protein
MGKRNLRSLGAGLTLAGAIVAVVLLVVPAALGRSAGDKFVVTYYTDADGKGNKVTHVGADQKFDIHGNNLGKAVEVFCYAGKDDNDTEADSPKGLDDIEVWTVLTGHVIRAEAPDPDCAGHRGPIVVLFQNGAYVSGPNLAVG